MQAELSEAHKRGRLISWEPLFCGCRYCHRLLLRLRHVIRWRSDCLETVSRAPGVLGVELTEAVLLPARLSGPLYEIIPRLIQ